MSEGKRLLVNTGIFAIGGFATKLVQFFLLPLYTSILSPAEYGTVDYLNTIALFCVPVVSLLMDEALFRALIDCSTDEERSRAMTSSCALMLIGSIVFAVGALVFDAFFAFENTLLVALLVFSGCALDMVSALLRGFGDSTGYALTNFAASAVTVVLNVLFIAVFKWGVVGMLAATILSQGGVSLVVFLVRKIWKYLKIRYVDRSYMARLLKYSVPLIPNKVSWTIMNMSSRLIIMNVLGSVEAGLFAIAYKFPNIMDQVYGFFYMSWKESSARVLNSPEDENVFYNRVYRALRRFMMGVVMVMTVLLPFVFILMIDDSYSTGILYVPVLLLATYYSNISGFYGGIFTAHKDTAIMGTTTIVSALICLGLNTLFIPQFGLYGASIATLVATFTVNEYRRVKSHEYANLQEDLVELVVTYACLVAVFVCFYVYEYLSFVPVLLVGTVIALCYFFIENRKILSAGINFFRNKLSERRG
jgi:O-antigen/teichoic acid export membrane protein